MKDVFTIVKNGEKSYWHKVGIQFPPNQDGSVNIKLFALPVSGELQVREQKKDKQS